MDYEGGADLSGHPSSIICSRVSTFRPQVPKVPMPLTDPSELDRLVISATTNSLGWGFLAGTSDIRVVYPPGATGLFLLEMPTRDI